MREWLTCHVTHNLIPPAKAEEDSTPSRCLQLKGAIAEFEARGHNHQKKQTCGATRKKLKKKRRTLALKAKSLRSERTNLMRYRSLDEHDP